MWQSISEQISAATGETFKQESRTAVSGGSINSAYVINGGQKSYFVKTNSAQRIDMFEAERDGLTEIAKSQTVKVPEVICVGSEGSQSYIVMENLDFHGSQGGNSRSVEQLGIDLAHMHKFTNERYGWYRNNTIGSTLQINDPSTDWVAFYRDHRLAYQYRLAAERGCKSLEKRGELLMSKLKSFFSAYNPPASLLHGDLWSGNYAIDSGGVPVIFDPATYYGDREADIAMTELFGGFSQRFYSAYDEVYALDDGYRARKVLYNLYHILNHFNLFGGGYSGQAERMTDQLLAEV
jgi:fructosamine-3-kinase